MNQIQGTLKIRYSTYSQDWELISNFDNICFGIINSYKNVLPPFYFIVSTGTTITTFKAVRKDFENGQFQNQTDEINLPIAQLYTVTKNTSLDYIVYYADDYLTTNITPQGIWELQISDGVSTWISEPFRVITDTLTIDELPFLLYENGDTILMEEESKISLESSY